MISSQTDLLHYPIPLCSYHSKALWDEFKHSICDDLQHRLENIWQYRDRVFTDEDVYDYGLHLINDNFNNFSKTLQNFLNMPEPQQIWNVIP
ncbi:hypothetical protein C0989_010567, partial [Termitomyces sp. Mn162]